ncbi:MULTISPECIES: DUF6328 family protein [Janibacter]|uniref:DUF6328 family protein n=1 Tax=Janibacter TaxID=53457 RepID=UPI00384FE9C7
MADRRDRRPNWNDLLQEFRVLKTGVQVLGHRLPRVPGRLHDGRLRHRHDRDALRQGDRRRSLSHDRSTKGGDRGESADHLSSSISRLSL